MQLQFSQAFAYGPPKCSLTALPRNLARLLELHRLGDAIVWMDGQGAVLLGRYRAPPSRARHHLAPDFTTTTTTTAVEVIESRAIVEIAISFGVELYRPIYIYIYLLISCWKIDFPPAARLN
jgi:hypothetical protein